MTDIRVLFADDQADDSERLELEATIRDALKSIGVNIDVRVQLENRLASAKDALVNQRTEWDIAVLDVFWRRSDDKPGRAGVDDLLRRSLTRSATVSIVISGGDTALTGYLYDPEKHSIRPHAAMHKDDMTQEKIVAGVISEAFSRARLPLRSRTGRYDWDLSQDPHLAQPAISKLAAEELSSMLLPPADSVRITPIAGGLSGATTLLVTSRREAPDSSVDVRNILVKADRDLSTLHRELRAHADLVPRLPGNLFASPIDKEIREFGGWYAIGFEQISGLPVAANPEAVLQEQTWNMIFSDSLLASWHASAEVLQSQRASDVLSGDLLAPQRLDRLHRHLDSLGLVAEVRGDLKLPLRDLFPSLTRSIPLVTVHGDLHTRNVLLADSLKPTWIDAASMSSRGYWPADLARFSVWLACGITDQQGASVSELVGALGFEQADEAEVTAPMWTNSLGDRVISTLQRVSEHWGAQKEIDIAEDWRCTVGAELLRAVYSSDWFDRQTRSVAATAAHVILREMPTLRFETLT